MATLVSVVSELLYAFYGFLALQNSVDLARTRPRTETNLTAAALFACYFPWAIFFGLQNAAVNLAMYSFCSSVFELCSYFLPAIFLHFQLSTHPGWERRKRGLARCLIYLPAIGLGLALLIAGPLSYCNPRFSQEGVWYVDRPTGAPGFYLMWAYILGYFVASYAVAVHGFRGCPQPDRKREIMVYLRGNLLLFLVVFLLLASYALLDEASYGALDDIVLGQVTFVATLVWLYSIRFALRRYRLVALRGDPAFKPILDALAKPIILLDESGMPRYLNSSARGLLGARGLKAWEKPSPESALALKDAFAKMRSDLADQADQARLRLELKNSARIDLSIYALRDGGGRLRAALCFLDLDGPSLAGDLPPAPGVHNPDLARSNESNQGLAEPRGLDSWELEASGISKRELEVLLLLARGMGAREIGQSLYISTYTVKNHIHSLYEKTGARNRVELVGLLNRAPRK